jgi:sugar O-acyltransferase (sialic acid O-acetyltransferase NeuD family)
MTSNLYGIYGASGFGREVLPILREQLGQQGIPEDRVVFVDDNPSAPMLNGRRVMTYVEYLVEPASSRSITLAIANSEIRALLAVKCAADGVRFIEVRANNSVVMDDVIMGEGSLLTPFVTLTSNIRIGCHFQANIYSYVAHDCVIGDFVTFAPAVKCNGNIVIEDHVYIGTGAILKQGKPGKPLIIGKGAVVAAGAVVTKNVPAGVTVFGNPAALLSKENLRRK